MSYWQLCPVVGVGARDVQGLPPLLAKPATRHSLPPPLPPTPSSHELSSQWNQSPDTLILEWKKGGKGGPNELLNWWATSKHCTKHMKLTQTRLAMFEQPNWMLTNKRDERWLYFLLIALKLISCNFIETLTTTKKTS